MAQHGHAIHPRQVQVEDNEVVINLASHRPRLFAIFGYIDRVMLSLQTLAHKVGQGRIVFGNQNSHKWTLITHRF
jgi:hypothetical protein